MRFGSVCSGIEAASMAWMPLGWEPAWFSEIEPFPCAVLKHHHPDVPNHGDMTTLPARILAGEVEAPDVLVGGTPCQAFSVAGLRQGLNDPRGRLTRTYVEICDAIDTVRAAAGKPPVILVWENVPGVLSDNGNAFGNFLGALSGEDGALEPPGGKWTNAGLVCGPARDLAWRVLDAQYFGVAQRRRRVFLVGHSRAGSLRPVKVLLVEQGVQRHSPPSREARQRAAAAPVTGAQGGGGGLGAGLNGGRGVATQADVAGPLDSHYYKGPGSRQGGEREYVAHVVAPPVVGFQTRGSNIDVGAISGTLGTNADRASGSAPMIAHVVAPPLCMAHGQGGAEIRVDGAPSLTCNHEAPIVFSDGGLNGQDAYTGRILPVAFTGDGVTADPISAHEGSMPTVAFTENHEGRVYEHDYIGSLNQGGGKPGMCYPAVRTGMAVRRLTPTECERLQGFPDEYTRIPWKRKPANECPDGPRYKALGNSMAVPCMMWIGRQIQKALV